ncbi:mitochondrial putative transcription factor A [Elysia marginata]|uniref:Mitochondrial putative transcription factor A n=1 Tax=Elysia marginata TaxID=1093978 RepID=A0AAV4FMS3_9GAST|nr:mitochondrial putative transcription factor A [Elysia marginata]
MAVASLCKSFSSKLYFTPWASIRLRDRSHPTKQFHHPDSHAVQICHIWAGTTYTNSKLNEQTELRDRKPRHPPNVFIMYLQNVQEQIQKENPKLVRKEIVAIASKRWKSVDPEEKSHLAMQRKELFKKYKEDMKNYLDNMTPEEMKLEERKKQQIKAKKLKTARRELGMPKMPASPFCCFMAEHYPQYAGEENVTQIFKRLRANWNNLSEADKEKYTQQSLRRSETYRDEMERWEKEMMELGRFDVIRKSTLLRLAMGNNPKKNKTDVDDL